MPSLDQIVIDDSLYEIVPEIAPLFDASTSYAAGDQVIKDGVRYRFMASHTGAWNASDVEETGTLGEEIAELKGTLNQFSKQLKEGG